jgi:hypothetical protein
VIQNVAMRVDGNKLVIEVDLSKEIGASSSGKGSSRSCGRGSLGKARTTWGAGARSCRRRRPLLRWAASTGERDETGRAIWMEDP